MSLFKLAENSSTYLKMGLLGFQGSGKTFTAKEVAIGLHKYIKSNIPIYMYDSELGSSYIKNSFDKEKIQLMRIQSRSFLSLIGAMKEVPEGGIFIIDSITHPWRDLLASFMKAKGITRIKMNHWSAIKSEWGQFNEWYINSKVHVLMAGRAGFEFDFEEDEEGNKDLIKSGIKMKSESEIGFEPSLLVQLIAEQIVEGNKVGGINNKAFVIKDRFGVINGQTFDKPNFETFLPHISLLNLNGIHQTLDGADSSTMFVSDRSISERLKQRDILVEEFYAEMPLHFNGRTDTGKSEGVTFLKTAFGSASKIAIENLPNEKIMAGLAMLRDLPLLTMEITPKVEPITPKTKKKENNP